MRCQVIDWLQVCTVWYEISTSTTIQLLHFFGVSDLGSSLYVKTQYSCCTSLVWVTSVKSVRYQSTTKLLPIYYQSTTKLLPIYYQSTTKPRQLQSTTICPPSTILRLIPSKTISDHLRPSKTKLRQVCLFFFLLFYFVYLYTGHTPLVRVTWDDLREKQQVINYPPILLHIKKNADINVKRALDVHRTWDYLRPSTTKLRQLFYRLRHSWKLELKRFELKSSRFTRVSSSGAKGAFRAFDRPPRRRSAGGEVWMKPSRRPRVNNFKWQYSGSGRHGYICTPLAENCEGKL